MKSNSNKFGSYINVNAEDNYNSIIDEYRRNKILYASKFFKINEDELFNILEIVIKKSFKIKRDLENELKFNFKNNNNTLNYVVEKYDPIEKEIILKWQVDKDKYWLNYKIKKIGKNSKINYKQVIFRERTFFGFQDIVGMYLYKNNFKKNIKSFNKSIEHVKNNPDKEF